MAGKTTSMRNCNVDDVVRTQVLCSLSGLEYGGSDGRLKVVSNLSRPYVDQVVREIERQDRLDPFLEPGKNLVVVNRDPKHLEYILCQLFPEYLDKSSQETIMTQMPHHQLPSAQQIYNVLNGSLIRAVYARCKGLDSLEEKFMRLCAERGGMDYTEKTKRLLDKKQSNDRLVLLPSHTAVEDIYGITVVCETVEDCLMVEKELSAHQLLADIETEDYLANPKKKGFGYSALHKTYIWMGNHIPTGTLLEVHFETEAGHIKNQLGNGDKRRSHRDYGLSKLRKGHTMGDNQLVVLDGVREPISLTPYRGAQVDRKILKN
tara:strand:- start:81 stop:1037 length:957 start_codon:yes stop_codon:yes gene_type:complete